MSQPIKVIYFDAPGKAEAIRIALTIGGIEFEDVRLVRDLWQSEFKATTPLGQVPVLQVGDKMLAESLAILRYAGKIAHLYPTDPWEAAKVDEFIYLLEDLGQARGQGGPPGGRRPGQGGQGQQELTPEEKAERDARMAEREAKLKNEVLPKFGPLLEKTIKSNGGPYAVGSSLTIADLWLNQVYTNITRGGGPQGKGLGDDAFDAFPAVKEAWTTLQSNPKLQAWKAAQEERAKAKAQ